MPITEADFPGAFTLYRVNPDGTETIEGGGVGRAMYFREEKTKGSARILPDGWRNATAYALLMSTSRCPVGEFRYKEPSGREYVGRGVYWPATAASSATLPPFPEGLRYKAEVDALLQLKGQDVDLGVAFAERSKTAQMVGDAASRLAKAYRHVRKGNFRKASSELGVRFRKQTSNWLELQYGWKPLLNDVYGSAKALAESMHEPKQWRVTVKGRSQESIRENTVVVAGNPAFFCDYSAFMGCFVRLDYIPSDERLIALSNLGLTNPLQIGWELAPYSFVVDWMLPIGDWLSSFDAALGYDFKSGSRSQITKSETKLRPFNDHSGPYRAHFNSLSEGRGRSVRLDRVAYTQSPLPFPPVPKNPVSLGHMANGLSLLAEAFGRRR